MIVAVVDNGPLLNIEDSKLIGNDDDDDSGRFDSDTMAVLLLLMVVVSTFGC